jgi:uncharacterized protein
MRLLLDNDSSINTVRAYQRDEVVIGTRRLRAPCIVSATRLIADWPVDSIATLTLEQLEPLLTLSPRIVLLGAVESSPRAPAPLRLALERRGIALETMELGAACRTYNVLAQEGREVVAGLLPLRSAPEEDTGRKDQSTNQLPEADRIE